MAARQFRPSRRPARGEPQRRGGPVLRSRRMHREGPTLSLDAAPRRVMVGTDRSESAEAAVRWAAGFAEQFDAELYVVQVLPRRSTDAEAGPAPDLTALG